MEFLCGVAVTLLVETAALIVATGWLRKKTGGDGNE